MLGQKYTWSNSQEGEKWSRIDRFLIHPEWLDIFNFKQWGLPRSLSDHCPIILMEDLRDWGPRPFKFINAWVLHPKCLEVMESAWIQSDEQGWAGYRIMRKLKSMKEALKEWNRVSFGNVQTQVEQVEKQLHDLDIKAEEGSILENDRMRRRELKADLWKLCRYLEWMWSQKSRENWNLKGDKNTKFFHLVASNRQRRNALNLVTVNDQVFDEPNIVKEEVKVYFQNLFLEDWEIRPRIGGFLENTISVEDADGLLKEFSEIEVWSAIMSCDGNKAPGPDGFNMLSVKKGWNFMKKDIMLFFSEFHRNGRLVRSMNSSFLALIPKVDNPIALSDYRPISLVGCMYKILTKVLTVRMKQSIKKVVGEVQSAFVGGRNIQDGILIANEMVDYWKKKKKKGLIIKLDFAKAYDNINWNLLFGMIKLMGYPQKWIQWIKECVSTARVLVLVNAAEGLNVLLKRAVSQGLLKGVVVGDQDFRLAQLQFADDTIIFCEAKERELVMIKRILRCFEVLSGLRINYHKSMVSGVGVEVHQLASFAEILRCKHQTLPIRYLGMPLGVSPRLKSTWKPVIEKVSTKLATWKRRHITFGGRLVLIKSALNNLPIYYMSLFKMPAGVIKKLESIQANFLWGSSDLKRKILFWKDSWLGLNPLSVDCPRLFSLAQNKEESLREMVDRRIERGEWVLTFRRRLRAWEEEAADTLKTVLIAAEVQTNDENSDHLRWEGCNSKVFTVQSIVGQLPMLVGCPVGTTIQCNGLVPMVEKLDIQGNEIFFKGINPVWSEIGELIKIRTAFWVRSTGTHKDYSINDFVYRLQKHSPSVVVDIFYHQPVEFSVRRRLFSRQEELLRE
ncbi:hypothetical protein Acr_00g0004350 [Actinidia rufa]|uniref:Reverse transcriptase domain-containing protein n=1 Tax=Actinidia rufa TaxID=165716 RepID=A0A7J0D929_9ERIC|nr:hypothetical protein Acr_00g0004350 [Actinidia rufa]